MYDLIVKNGQVVSPSSTVQCDIAVKDGKIAALGKFGDSEADRVIDAAGKYVLPGGVEAQKIKLEAEGHVIARKGRTNIKYYVRDFEMSLFPLT